MVTLSHTTAVNLLSFKYELVTKPWSSLVYFHSYKMRLLRDFVWWQFCSNLLVFRNMSCGVVTLLSSCQASDLKFESDWVGFFVSCFVLIVFLLSSIHFFSWFVFPLIPAAGAFGSSRHIVYPGCNVRAAKDQWKIKYKYKYQNGTKLALPFEPEDARTKKIQSQSVGWSRV